MNKGNLHVGQKVYWDGKKDNVAVTVVDVTLEKEKVGIMDGGITHIVYSHNLTETPSASSNIVLADKLEPLADKQYANTKPLIEMLYDKKVHSLFIKINDKTTICIPGVIQAVINEVGISYKHDDDNYNEEIGNALAFYRSEVNRNAEAECSDYLKSILCGKF